MESREYLMDTLNLTIVEFDIKNHTSQQLTFGDFQLDPTNKDKIYWIHVDLNQQRQFEKLIKKIHLREDIVELYNDTDAMPKFIDAGDALTIKIQALLNNELRENEEVEYGNLVIHLTDNYCFTAAYDPLPALIDFSLTYPKAVKYAKTPCFILFLVLDNIVNNYADVLLDYELVADKVDLMIRSKRDDIYNEIVDIKKQVMKIKRYLAAIRDILMRVSGRKISVVSEQCRMSLENLFNHSQMIVNEADLIRDSLNSTLDQIDNALMQKMNKTMKILTSFAAIFLPLSLIAGIYGMNFQWMPELQWKYGYFWALGLMLICGTVLGWTFKRLKWF